MSRQVTRTQLERADRKVRAEGWSYKPENAAEWLAFSIRYPDCMPARRQQPKRTADTVITSRGHVQRLRTEAEASEARYAEIHRVKPEVFAWKSSSYWLNFVPRAACSWRPTLPFGGHPFEPRPLP